MRVAICGFRKKGRELLKRMHEEHMQVAYIIERNYEALSTLEKDIGIPIVGFGENLEFYAQAERILLTGDIPESTVAECLKVAGIDLPLETIDKGEW